MHRMHACLCVISGRRRPLGSVQPDSETDQDKKMEASNTRTACRVCAHVIARLSNVTSTKKIGKLYAPTTRKAAQSAPQYEPTHTHTYIYIYIRKDIHTTHTTHTYTHTHTQNTYTPSRLKTLTTTPKEYPTATAIARHVMFKSSPDNGMPRAQP
jgi:hypothetical protein